ncbi:MAG: PQQ-binding-like beta-propeller repeat protein [Hyphomonadaceae bacterium]
MLRTITSGLALAAALAISSCTTPDTQTATTSDPVVQAAHNGAATLAAKAAGEEVYKKHCAACHDNPEVSKAPSRETLSRVSALYVTNALIMGKMTAQGAPLSAVEVSNVSDYLSGGEANATGWIEPNRCPANRRTPKLDAKPTVSGFGYNYSNRRELSYAQSGLKPGDLDNMEVAWTLAFPQVSTMRGQAAVVGDTLFLPMADNNRLFALDISTDKPCVQWVYDGGRSLRTSAGYGEMSNGQKIVMVGDMGGFVHAIDAKTGRKMWEADVKFFQNQMVTSTPVLYKDRVYAPISQYELPAAAANSYVCCKARGGITALDAKTGKKIWAQATMPEAQPLKDRGDGQFIWGPSGAPIWNSASLDVKRNRLYVGTGEANSGPAHPNTDALLSFDLDTGKIVWAHQATADDVYNLGCFPGRESNKNCSGPTVYRDVDFGASTIFTKAPNGKELVLGGQKSGSVWAMNPDDGSVIWRTALGHGTAMGGIHWGIAADDNHIYAPISNVGRAVPTDPAYDAEKIKPGLYALNLNDGSIAWQFNTTPDCPDERKARLPGCQRLAGISAAPSVIGDYVVAGGLDGMLYVLDRKTGALKWKYDTAQKYTGANGVEGNGGSFDAASIIATHGLLIVNSGYGMFGQAPGNVMIAFKPKH